MAAVMRKKESERKRERESERKKEMVGTSEIGLNDERCSARDKCYGVNANGPPSSTEITRLLGM